MKIGDRFACLTSGCSGKIVNILLDDGFVNEIDPEDHDLIRSICVELDEEFPDSPGCPYVVIQMDQDDPPRPLGKELN